MELRKWLGRETKTRAAGYGQGVADYDARHLRHYLVNFASFLALWIRFEFDYRSMAESGFLEA